MNRFEGKTSLVTGAGSGIGRAAAYRIAREGGRVFCADIAADALNETVCQIEREGGTAAGKQCDIGNEVQVNACVNACIAQYGTIDSLINMAGILKFANCHELALADWERVINVNLTGTFLINKAVLPHLVASKGAIVNAASTASLAGLPWGACYAASKGGVLALTRSIAVEYAKRGVRANCVCPGDISTPMAAQVRLPDDADYSLLNRITSLSGALGPEVVAGTIALLASEDGIHINGEEIRVDGGMLA